MASQNAITNSSLGLSSTLSPLPVRGITRVASLGLTSTLSPKNLRGITKPASLGLSSTSRANSVRGIVFPISIGITPTVAPSISRSVAAVGSIGLTGRSSYLMGRSLSTLASLGLSGTSFISRLYVPSAMGSVGLSFTGALRTNFVRGTASGNLGITFVGRFTLKRNLFVRGSLGLSARVTVSVIPGLSPGGITLVEIQDGAGSATYGSLVAREYQNLYLDTTTASYPKPFKLLN